MRVLVAMSGGVDSSVAAALLVEAGHDVVGRHHEAVGRPLRHGLLLGRRRRRRPAGGPAARHRPSRVQLLRGLRPPSGRRLCGRPRRRAARRTRASSATATSSSTGCWPGPTSSASTRWPPAITPGSRPAPVAAGRLRRGVDPAKDQSYVLHMLGQAQLARVRLPVGELTKAEVRPIAADSGCAPRPSRTARTCASSPGRAGARRSSGSRIPLRPGAVVDGDRRGRRRVPAVELVTVGQRQRAWARLDAGRHRAPGVAGARASAVGRRRRTAGDGRRYVVEVDVAGATVTRRPAGGSAGHRDRRSGTRSGWTAPRPGEALEVQVSAHGRPGAGDAGRRRRRW